MDRFMAEQFMAEQLKKNEAFASLMTEESTEGRKGKQAEREMEPRSDVWPYFVRFTDDEDGERKARCKRCDRVLLARHGTTSLWKHVDTCGGQQAAAAVGVEAASDGAAAGAHDERPTHLGPADMIRAKGKLHMQQQERNAGLGPRAQPMKPAVRAPPRRQKPYYRGVRERHYVKWEAEIRLPRNRTPLLLGSFDTAKEAALAYDRAAYRLHGRAARLNFPDNAASMAPLDPAIDAKLQATCASIADAPVVEAATPSNKAFDLLDELPSMSGSETESFRLSNKYPSSEIDWDAIFASPSNCSSHEGSMDTSSPSNFSSHDGSVAASPSNCSSHEGSVYTASPSIPFDEDRDFWERQLEICLAFGTFPREN